MHMHIHTYLVYISRAVQDVSHDKEVALVWLDSDEIEEPTQQRVFIVAHVLYIVGQHLCIYIYMYVYAYAVHVYVLYNVCVWACMRVYVLQRLGQELCVSVYMYMKIADDVRVLCMICGRI